MVGGVVCRTEKTLPHRMDLGDEGSKCSATT
jgi:hypothetical protein